MARKHFARAIVSQKNVQFDAWMESLRNQHEGAVPKDHVHRIAKNVLRKCNPNQYLLSHATIVASVDTYAPKKVKLGKQMNSGIEIDVRWPNFRVKPECHDIINNNGDAWERSLLLSTYRTFIGAQNYLEHIQLPELSKGFIVDAIARDLGKTAYIDILVATDRKHAQLIRDIQSGKIDSMSMGCISLFTTCSRCGNVAADDSQVCPCVSYMGKHAKFVDEEGINQVVCELIGNVAVPNSNQFIEASWVGNPAFRGAVRRNILNPDEVKLAAQLQEAELVAKIRSQVQVPDGIAKAASLRIAEEDLDAGGDADSGSEDSEGSEDDAPSFDLDSATDSADSDGDSNSEDSEDTGSDSPDAPKADSADSKIDSMLESVQEQILQSIAERLAEKLAPKPEDVGSVSIQSPDLIGGSNSNDNLVRSSEEFARRVSKKFAATPRLVRWAIRNYCIVHIGGRKAIANRGLTEKDLLVLSWIEDRVRGLDYSSNLYKTAMAVGSLNRYPSSGSFLAACKRQLGRELTVVEKQFFTRKGRIASIAKP